MDLTANFTVVRHTLKLLISRRQPNKAVETSPVNCAKPTTPEAPRRNTTEELEPADIGSAYSLDTLKQYCDEAGVPFEQVKSVLRKLGLPITAIVALSQLNLLGLIFVIPRYILTSMPNPATMMLMYQFINFTIGTDRAKSWVDNAGTQVFNHLPQDAQDTLTTVANLVNRDNSPELLALLDALGETVMECINQPGLKLNYTTIAWAIGLIYNPGTILPLIKVKAGYQTVAYIYKHNGDLTQADTDIIAAAVLLILKTADYTLNTVYPIQEKLPSSELCWRAGSEVLGKAGDLSEAAGQYTIKTGSSFLQWTAQQGKNYVEWAAKLPYPC